MAPQIRSLFLAVFSLLISAAFSSSLNDHHPHHKHVAMFVFGDSLFDPGNNLYLNTTPEDYKSRFPPYGMTFFHEPTGRFSDGRVVPDFMAEFFKLPIWKALLAPGPHKLTDGANFASAGAGVLFKENDMAINLPSQLSYFKGVVSTLKKQIGEEETRKLLHSAVFLISMGGNDYFTHYVTHPHASASTIEHYVDTVIGNLTEFLKEIYYIGGRKIAFQNVGALGCVPGNIAKSPDGKSCLDDLSARARLHNFKLSKTLENLEKRLPGFKYSIFDYYHTIQDMVFHPSKYGFEHGKTQCHTGGSGHEGTLCDDPNKYVFFDGSHTGDACNWQLAKMMWKGEKNVVSPYNVKQLYEL